MNPLPLVSLLIPAFNPRFFERTLNSAVSQTYGQLEIIVCDDSRGSEIEDIVVSVTGQTGVAVRYVRNPRTLGMVGNLKACLEQAQGQLIKFVCDDDHLYAACIEQQAQEMAREEVRLVLAQRLFWDADDIILPARLENTSLSPVSGLFKGDDLLGIFEKFPVNVLGGFTNALFRREDLVELLPALTQEGHCFVASLDFALFVCLMRRGNVAVSNNVLSAERLYPERLSAQQSMKDAVEVEREWILQMLNARSGESAPAPGWVRYIPLSKADEMPRVWEELPLSRTLGTKQSRQEWCVGIDSWSFADLYAQWLECRVLTEGQRKLLPETLAAWSHQPRIVPIVIDRDGSRDGVERTLEALAAQDYLPELILVLSAACSEAELDGRVFRMPLQDDGLEQLNALLPQLEGADWFYLLQAGDRLVVPALLIMAERIAHRPALTCLYSDEGSLRNGESVEPAFKPDFNLDLMRSYPYVGRALAFKRERFLALGGFEATFAELAPHDMLWRMVESDGTQVVGHVAEVLLQSPFDLSAWLAAPAVIEQNPRLLEAHLKRLGVAHGIRRGSSALLNRIDYQHARRPLVSIIIVTKDQTAALQRCVETLLEKTAYSEYELLLVDNGSESAEARAWLDGMAHLAGERIRVLSYPQQGNAAALHNFAVGQACGEYVLLLNSFAVITQADWLDELLNHAQRPEVGVVGAKLFNPDGCVLHAGLILGLQGAVGLPFYGQSLQSDGYMFRLQAAHDLSAVGGDCLMVRKVVYESVAGLDEQALKQTLNVVDLCLRIGQEGYLVVWTPYALLALGARPGALATVEEEQLQLQEQETFYKRWLPRIARDPAFNVNLTLQGVGATSFSLEPGLRTGWSAFSRAQLPNVLAVPINASAIGHYRMSQPLIELEAANRAEGRICYGLPSIIDIERQSPDVIVLQGRYSQGAIDEIPPLKKFCHARRIYELDDYVVDVPHRNAHIRNMPNKQEMERMVRRAIGLCDRVVVSTQPLANALSGMHHDIRVVPNMLARNLWTGLRGQRRTSKKPRVGWGGGTSHHGDLAVIADVVRELANEVDWVFFGMCPDDLRPYMHEFHGVIPLEVYPAKLASLNLDLALAPLEFHIFNDCKSNLRLLEYGACGYPVVCTDTEAYRGYLPCTRVKTNTTDEWLQAIRMHLADPDASYRMGDELREVVLRDYVLRGDNLRYWENGWLAD
ncbi:MULTISPECIES: glycosyltransferase [unclassified Pseudomonas]|uniref:glycosyltransferase n=1 Tax=unclassified Pseudomonas TaxID=196821 RepID=UPI000C8360D3|nr:MULTISPECIES: glycosyltransferase [unclassified Pseudomonas]MDX9673485.1 glycosyltransferase [Pseudomonas sp. P8_250]PMQ12572.1 GalNAc(5)-diNAcBac-PP-undecaprenol beta-1,3-glucosyltransferase [Pseudomonas sp. AD21]WPN37981.1 glycosyltransferase [Pseudomonas sp. P8_139]WPN40216.1 glycosyltransferase [Pseudomonas sp. P8_229]